MTSPKTDLPLVTNGMIWDGVTEYSDVRPSGLLAVYLLRMYGDGTRRFSERYVSPNPMQDLLRRQALGWDPIGVTLTNPYYYLNVGFLAYDGSLSNESVNQYFQVQNFRAHAARFAHQLDAGMGTHTLLSADERDRLIVHQSLSAMIGSAARRYAEWDAIDPEELIVGGEFDGTLLWKHHDRTVQDYIDIDAALCGQCDIDEYAREFFFSADLPAFRRVWRQGLIYSADRTMNPWTPNLFDAAAGNVSDFHEDLDAHFQKMLRHYAQVVAVQDRTDRQ